jgi:hypothetical protein
MRLLFNVVHIALIRRYIVLRMLSFTYVILTVRYPKVEGTEARDLIRRTSKQVPKFESGR